MFFVCLILRKFGKIIRLKNDRNIEILTKIPKCPNMVLFFGCIQEKNILVNVKYFYKK